MKKQLEIACFNLESALVSQQAGADRVELCDGFDEGGTTPALETVQKAHEQLTIDLYVMIRPRGGSFDYTDEELYNLTRKPELTSEEQALMKILKKRGEVISLLTALYPQYT
jgi:copper homeostasis protein